MEKLNTTTQFCIFKLVLVPDFNLIWQFSYPGPKRVFLVEKMVKWISPLNSAYTNWCSKFQFKLTILIFWIKTKNRAFSLASMVITYYIKFFHTGANRRNGILMPLRLEAAGTKRAKEKKKMIPLWTKKLKEKQNSATIMIPVGEKGTVFLVKLKLQGELFE